MRSLGVVLFLLVRSQLPALIFFFPYFRYTWCPAGWKGSGMAALSVVFGGVRLGDAFGIGFDERGSD